LTEKQRESLIKNLAGPLSQARRPIQEGFLAHVYKVHPDYGTRLAKAIGIPINKAKL
jgi:catalase